MVDIEEENGADSAHFQISFFSGEKILENFPESVFNVPSSSDSEQFNNLINKVVEGIEGK